MKPKLIPRNQNGNRLKEITVTAPKKHFVGYDTNANPVYTTDYKQSQEYLLNQIPLNETEEKRRQWSLERKSANGLTRPGLHGDAEDLSNISQIGIGLPLLTLASGPIAESIIKPVVDITANPIVSTVTTIHGSLNVPSNIKQGVKNIKDRKYLNATYNFGTSAFDLLGTGLLVTRTGRMLRPSFRRLHAFNSITPVSYESPFKRGYQWLKDMWYNEPIEDLSNPKWYRSISEINGVKNPRPVDGYTGTGNYLADDIKNAGKIADEARLDAWALHNRLPLQYNTYIKNADGSYSYNMNKIMKESEGTWHPRAIPTKKKKQMDDFVTGAGGGLTDFRLIKSDDTGFEGVMHLEDLNDYHPFSRASDKLSKRLFPKLHDKLFAWSVSPKVNNFSPRLSNKLYKLSEKSLFPHLDKLMSKFEIGMITGGKPFLMSTDIPFHTNIVLEPLELRFKYGFNPNNNKFLRDLYDWNYNLKINDNLQKLNLNGLYTNNAKGAIINTKP